MEVIKRNRSDELGSVIFWIFLGIALFAALGFTISHISRSGGAGMNEVARLRATDIMQYSNAVQRAVRNMRINGVDESYLCFHSDLWGHNDYEFTPQCDNNENRVFHADGGNVKFQQPDADWYDSASSPANGDRVWVFSARFEITNVGTDDGDSGDGDATDTDSQSADLVMTTAPLKQDICEAINDMLGYSPPTPPSVPASTYNELATNKFQGSYGDDSGRIGDLGRERCVTDPAGFNIYYKVILAR